MTTTVFDKVGTGEANTVDQQTTPDTSTKPAISIPPEVADLIGEGKKYATVEKALTALKHSQEHIKRLEAETADLRSRKADVDEILANMSKGSSQEDTTPSIDEDTVADRVITKLTAKEAADREKKNLELASTKLAEKAGSVDAAALLIVEKATQLGLNPNELRRIAEKSPTAFLAYFDDAASQKSADSNLPPKGGLNTQAMANVQKVEQGTYAWYQAQRKANGDRWYFSEATTKARTRDLDRLGRDKFFGK